MCYSVVKDLLVSISIPDCKLMWEKSWVLILGMGFGVVIIVTVKSGRMHILRVKLKLQFEQPLDRCSENMTTWSNLSRFLRGKTRLFTY